VTENAYGAVVGVIFMIQVEVFDSDSDSDNDSQAIGVKEPLEVDR
jgi:hypothetical protein